MLRSRISRAQHLIQREARRHCNGGHRLCRQHDLVMVSPVIEEVGVMVTVTRGMVFTSSACPRIGE
jgi:hypothetical protein